VILKEVKSKEREMDRVKGKVAIITGAAGRLGRVEAAILAKEGAKVVVTDILEAEGNKVAEEIRNTGREAVFMKLDVTNESSWDEAVEKTLSKYGKLDILVNNAGILLIKKIEETLLDEWRWLMSINLDGVFLGTKYGIRAMKNCGGGSIVNISSVVGLVATLDDTSAFCASKGGVTSFTKAAALECSKAGHDYNIRVNSIHPGTIKMTDQKEAEDDAHRMVPPKMEVRYPIGYAGEPEDVAYAVLYLASDESKFITGAEIVIDGGWTIQ